LSRVTAALRSAVVWWGPAVYGAGSSNPPGIAAIYFQYIDKI
jgi:hypothetical protein